jgi:hypothetical protein
MPFNLRGETALAHQLSAQHRVLSWRIRVF